MNPITILTDAVSISAAFSINPVPIDDGAFFNTVAIRGTVREDYGTRGILGAMVYAVSQTGLETTMTDRDGHFYFLNLVPGDYRLGAVKSDHLSSCICCRHNRVALNAGAEYDATVWLHRRCL